MTAGTGAERRRWWVEWLGAGRADDARSEVGQPVPGPHGTLRFPFTVHSFGTRLEAVLLRPAHADGPQPAVVVPWYEVASAVGKPCPRVPGRTRRHRRRAAYALHLVQHDVAVLVVPWWFEYVLTDAASNAPLAARYSHSVTRHEATVEATGLGRSIADLMTAVDGLSAIGWVARDRIGAFGHSLGGKLAMHLAALDPRIRAGVAHEPGLGFAHSNWSDPWYLGARVPVETDQDDLLSLVAPRPFLIAGGGASDGAHNQHLMDRAGCAGDGSWLTTSFHAEGHHLPPRVRSRLYRWLVGHLVPRARTNERR